MWIVAMYTTKYRRLVHMHSLVLLGRASLLLIVGIRLAPLGFTRFVSFITLVTLVTLPIIFFFEF